MTIHQLVNNLEYKNLHRYKKKTHELSVGDTIRVAVLTRELEPVKEKKDKKAKSASLPIKTDTVVEIKERQTKRAKVKQKVLDKWKSKDRVQPYEGTIIAKHSQGMQSSVTVRRVFQGIGVERTIPLLSPSILWLKLKRRSRVRRAKLYYLRSRSGRATRLREGNTTK